MITFGCIDANPLIAQSLLSKTGTVPCPSSRVGWPSTILMVHWESLQTERRANSRWQEVDKADRASRAPLSEYPKVIRDRTLDYFAYNYMQGKSHGHNINNT